MTSTTLAPPNKNEVRARLGMKRIVESVFGDIDGAPTAQANNDGLIAGKFQSRRQVYDYNLTSENRFTYKESNAEPLHSDSFLRGFGAGRHDRGGGKHCTTGTACGDTCIQKGDVCRIGLEPQMVRQADMVRQLLSAIPKPAGVLRSPNSGASKPAKPKAETAKAKSPMLALPIGAEAIALAVPALAIAAGGAYISDDPQGSLVAITRIHQDAMQSSGMRTAYPMAVNTLERFLTNSNKGNFDKELATALNGSIFLAHAENEANLDRGKNFATPGERIAFMGQMMTDDNRSADFQFALRKFAKEKKVPPYPEELAALRYYTDTVGYKEMNMTLRGQHDDLNAWLKTQNWKKDNRNPQQVKEDAERDIKMVNSALNGLPDFSGTAYRGLTLPDSVVNSIEVGGNWKEVGFTSTTRDPFISYPGNVAMVIKSRTGKNIEKFEKFANKEILFRPNTDFTVKSKRKVNKFGREFWLVEMEEAATRTDSAKLNCGPKSHQCGQACVPIDHQCKTKPGEGVAIRTTAAPLAESSVEAPLGSPKAMRVLEQQEASIRNLPYERAIAIDPKSGEVLFNLKGDRTSVFIGGDAVDKMKGSIFTHNHPNLGWTPDNPCSKGLSFSKEDVRTACVAEVGEMRAVSSGYVHSLRPAKGGWSTDYYKKVVEPAYERNYNLVYRNQYMNVVLGRRTANQANAEFHHEVMRKISKELGMRYRRKAIAQTQN